MKSLIGWLKRFFGKRRQNKEEALWLKEGRTTEQLAPFFSRQDLKKMKKYGVVESRKVKKPNGQIVILWRFTCDFSATT